MASLEQQLKLLTEEIAQLNAKLDDVSEKIDDEMCKAESAQNPALLGRLTKKEERLMAEKDELAKLRSKLLTGGQVAASSAAVPTAAAPSVAAPPVAPISAATNLLTGGQVAASSAAVPTAAAPSFAAPPVAPISAATNAFFGYAAAPSFAAPPVAPISAATNAFFGGAAAPSFGAPPVAPISGATNAFFAIMGESAPRALPHIAFDAPTKAEPQTMTDNEKARSEETKDDNVLTTCGRGLMKDPCHPHPLEYIFLGEDWTRLCDICYMLYTKETAYCGYICKGCNYSAHIACLSSPVEIQEWTKELEEQYLADAIGPLAVKDPCHPHALNRTTLPQGSYCDICYVAFNKKDGSYGYLCAMCNYGTHFKCLTSPEDSSQRNEHADQQYLEESIGPLKVKDPSHPHFLDLATFREEGAYCSVCYMVFTSQDGFHGYFCKRCNYAAHAKCLKSAKAVRGGRNEEEDSKEDMEKGSHGAPEGEQGGGGEEKEEEEPQEEADHEPVDWRTVQDPCHPHVLKCYNYGACMCDICKSTIDAGSDNFGCRDCNFSAHFSCLTADLGLPPKLTDVRHPHGLTLHASAKRGDLQGRYACAGCEGIGRTWVYECDEAECDFKVHPHCSRVEVKGHSAFGHWLALNFAEQSPCALPDCALKGTRSYVLRCCVADWKEGATCDLFLHVDCANKIVAPHAPQRAAETVAAIKAAKEAAEAHLKQLQIVQLQMQNQQMAFKASVHNQNMNMMNISRLDNMLGWRSGF